MSAAKTAAKRGRKSSIWVRNHAAERRFRLRRLLSGGFRLDFAFDSKGPWPRWPHRRSRRSSRGVSNARAERPNLRSTRKRDSTEPQPAARHSAYLKSALKMAFSLLLHDVLA